MSKRRLLSEIDAVLTGIDKELRVAEDIRIKEKVDRLIESAAQNASGNGIDRLPIPDEFDGDWLAWSRTVEYTKEGWARHCQRYDNGCWDSFAGEHLDCKHDAEMVRDPASNAFVSTSYASREVIKTSNNVDVIDNPVDGIDFGYTYTGYIPIHVVERIAHVFQRAIESQTAD